MQGISLLRNRSLFSNIGVDPARVCAWIVGTIFASSARKQNVTFCLIAPRMMRQERTFSETFRSTSARLCRLVSLARPSFYACWAALTQMIGLGLAALLRGCAGRARKEFQVMNDRIQRQGYSQKRAEWRAKGGFGCRHGVCFTSSRAKAATAHAWADMRQTPQCG